MNKKLFPEIPSCLELSILDYSGYCPICVKYTDHNLVACYGCDSILCLDHLGGIYTLTQPIKINSKFICEKCRITKTKTKTPIIFCFNPKNLFQRN